MSRRRRRNRENEAFGLSFLDAICCGFGAIVLLLVITKTAEPTQIRVEGTGLESVAEELAERLPQLEQRMESLQQKLAAQRERLAEARQRVARLEPKADAAAERALEVAAAAAIEKRLAQAYQELTDVMQRLYQTVDAQPSSYAAGIPVDSEYIVFVIDTSGSMHRHAWGLMLRKMRQVLQVYPDVKGIQVMNDMGEYMFEQYAGQWIPDTPGRRDIILDTLRTWTPFSTSNPVGGIITAIRAFAEPGKQISIYVLGDEFTGPSIQAVLDRVERINPEDAQGNPLVRIHAIGFPTQFVGPGISSSGIRFANLMRNLTHMNAGTFVGLAGVQ